MRGRNGFTLIELLAVIAMSNMYSDSKARSIDLSNFNIDNVTNMNIMFSAAKATTVYAKDLVTADKFNESSVTGIPSTLKFAVK